MPPRGWDENAQILFERCGLTAAIGYLLACAVAEARREQQRYDREFWGIIHAG